jgi:2-polyprenyl-6-methoxyphenol hydroxylase-like FAD-dependent oxidoreductase
MASARLSAVARGASGRDIPAGKRARAHRAGGVSAFFAGGRRETADLRVAADGVLSAVRRQYLPGVGPAFAEYVAWRGLVEERDMPRKRSPRSLRIRAAATIRAEVVHELKVGSISAGASSAIRARSVRISKAARLHAIPRT